MDTKFFDDVVRGTIEETFTRLQRERGLEWREAAHALIIYGVDALHINAGPGGVEAELIAARSTVEEAMVELRDEQR
jgi:hypothetical protein